MKNDFKTGDKAILLPRLRSHPLRGQLIEITLPFNAIGHCRIRSADKATPQPYTVKSRYLRPATEEEIKSHDDRTGQ
jgi:hypothetical protein